MSVMQDRAFRSAKSIRHAIGWAACIGCLAFGLAFVVSWWRPVWVEQIAEKVIRAELEQRARGHVQALSHAQLNQQVTQAAQRVLASQRAEAERLRNWAEDGLPRRVVDIVAQMRQPDCTCRLRVEQVITQGIEGRREDLLRVNERLDALIRIEYMNIAHHLTNEFRIFSGANAAVLLLLGLAAAWQRVTHRRLLLLAGVMLGGAGVVAALYLFKQDWLHTLVFSDYLGYGYVGYLAVMLAFLSDVVFNRGRLSGPLAQLALALVAAVFVPISC